MSTPGARVLRDDPRIQAIAHQASDAPNRRAIEHRAAEVLAPTFAALEQAREALECAVKQLESDHPTITPEQCHGELMREALTAIKKVENPSSS